MTGTGRLLIVGDIHGYAHTLVNLLEQANLQKEDRLFLLGDYISRGPHSAQVLNNIMAWQKEGFQIYPLRGNHEQMALDSHTNRLKMPEAPIHKRKSRTGLLNEQGLLLPHYYEWMSQLPFFYELENAWLAHAGINFSATSPFEDTKAMIWQNAFEYDAEQAQGKYIIHGHTSRTRQEIEKAVALKQPVICLDSGSYKLREEGKGHLCCLDFTNWQLYWASCAGEAL